MPTETRAEYLERNIAEVRLERSMLQNRSRLDHAEDDRLRLLEQRMTAELNAIRPYAAQQIGAVWVIAHKGMFVTVGGNWLRFKTEAAAQDWISQQEGVAA